MKKIIISDSMSDDVFLTIESLKASGFQVMHAQSEEESLKLLNEVLPDIVLLGSNMENSDCIELCTKIKEAAINPPIVIIYSYESRNTDHISESFESGADGYIQRPVSNRELVARIDSYLRLRKREDEIKKNEKHLQHLINQNNTVFSIIAHDLKTPFNSILGFSDLLISDLDEMEEDEINISAQTIYSSALEANNLLDNLLEWSKLNWRSSVVKAEAFNLKEMVSEIIIIFQSLLDLKSIKVKNEVSAKCDVFGDRNMIQAIIRNLFTNAFKFSFEKGKIYLRSAVENDHVILTVKDEGTGIPAENIQKILQKDLFFTTKGTSQEKGSGLGLNICFELAEKNNGKIWIESEVGKGSSFFLSLPFKLPVSTEELEIPKANNLSKQGDYSNKTFLIAEDLDHVYRFLEYILSKTGASCIWARNGQEAIDRIKENDNIDLVLMDIQMPVMNGFDASREIRRMKPDLPIIAQTAYSQMGEKEKSMAAGCNEYILKPIDLNELKSVISKYL